MADEETRRVRGIEMSDAEVTSFLKERGHGTLSLAKAGAAYAVPVSFGYDGDRLYVNLIRFGEDSEKLEYVDGTTEACVSSYEADGRFEWRSVVVRGPLTEIPEDEADHAEEVMAEGAWIPSLFPPTEAMTAVERYALEIESATGRKGEAYQ